MRTDVDGCRNVPESLSMYCPEGRDAFSSTLVVMPATVSLATQETTTNLPSWVLTEILITGRIENSAFVTLVML